MKFRNPFKPKARGGVINAIRGVTEAEWYNIYEAIKLEHDRTGLTHKKPTEYMRGLAFAMGVMEAVMPHNIAEVK